MYNGHIDTKPPGDLVKWNTDPFNPIVKQDKIFGLGSTDMKAGVAALIYASSLLNEVRDRLNGNLILILNGDEEAGGAFGAEYITQNSKDFKLEADIALIAEPSGLNHEWEYLDVGSRGESCF